MRQLFLLFFICSTTLNAQTPSVLWSFDTNDNAFGQSAMADLNNDGEQNVVFGCHKNDGMIYALNSDGSLLWFYDGSENGEGCNDAAPLIFDFDDDGTLDVVVPGSCNSKTWCLDGATGEEKWITETRGSASPPAVDDMDGDGRWDVLHGEYGGYVICIDGIDGMIKWEVLVDADSDILTAPTITDLNGDGQLDFVVATRSINNESKLYAFNGLDRSLMWSFDLNGAAYHGSAVVDLVEDGYVDIVVGDSTGTLWAINGADGNMLWSFDGGGTYASSVAVGDLNMDGLCDLVFSASNKVYAINNAGMEIWAYDIPSSGSNLQGVALSDVTGDGGHDVVFGTSSGELIAVNGMDGTPLWDVDLQADYGDDFSIGTAPIIGDFNDDGKLNVFVVGGDTSYVNVENNYGRAYAVQAGDFYGQDWPMFQYDARRGSNACYLPPTSSNTLQQQTKALVFPNPASTHIQLNSMLLETSSAMLILFDYTGRKVYESFVNKNEFINVSGLTKGIYNGVLIQGAETEYFRFAKM